MSEARLLDLVGDVPSILDEPIGDQSILPTYLLSSFTRGSVKVALGGDGSDELLMGYKAYRALKIAWNLDRIPIGGRRPAGLASAPQSLLGVPLRGVRFCGLLDRVDTERLLSHLGSFKGDGEASHPTRARRSPSSVFEGADLVVGTTFRAEHTSPTTPSRLRSRLPARRHPREGRPGVHGDVARVRAPFLDSDLIDLLLRTPEAYKLKGLTGKHLLRRLMRGRLPQTR